MAEKATGQCLCRAVKYEITIPEKPLYSGLCHCKDCQRYTGTAFESFSLEQPIATPPQDWFCLFALSSVVH